MNAKAGDAILTKFIALFGDPKFPSPVRILAADFDSLRACGRETLLTLSDWNKWSALVDDFRTFELPVPNVPSD
jgi:hypothetical protein